jgi:hypothetical protein
MKHTVVSPSQSERFFNCPGSVREQAKIDIIEPSSKEQLEGSAIHEFAAGCLKEDKDPYDCMGEIVEVKDNYGDVIEFNVNDDFAFCTRMYRNKILSILEQEKVSKKALQVEAKYSLPEIDKDARGTTDCSFVAGHTLYVLDLKAGRGVLVSPEENKQCMYYALRPFFDARMFISRIVLVVVQPRAKAGEYIKEWETTPKRLDQFAEDLKKAIADTRKKDAPLKPGEWCRWCKAQSVCGAPLDKMADTLKPLIPAMEKVMPKITELTPEQIGQVLPALETVKEVIKQLYGYAFSLASKGTDIPNYSLTKSKKQRRWRDENAVVQELEDEFGDEIYKTELRSPAQLEKIAGKERVQDFIYVPEGDLKLVPTKETKEAISRKVEEVFKNVEIE